MRTWRIAAAVAALRCHSSRLSARITSASSLATSAANMGSVCSTVMRRKAVLLIAAKVILPRPTPSGRSRLSATWLRMGGVFISSMKVGTASRLKNSPEKGSICPGRIAAALTCKTASVRYRGVSVVVK